MRHAFSLVELAIVLVIIGLLVGGVLAAQDLIRAAELRSVTTQLAKYNTGIRTFQLKYNALPGDIRNATDYWGTDPDGCPTHTNRIPKRETCNGDGNGWLSVTAEKIRAWQHLANAGFVEGQYSGVTGAVTVFDVDPGINAPALKITNGCVNFDHKYSKSTITGTVYDFIGPWGNLMSFGKTVSWDCVDGGFTPREMFDIDTKIDDGKPGMGRIITRVSCVGAGCQTNCNTASVATDAATATYLLNVSERTCAAHYKF